MTEEQEFIKIAMDHFATYNKRAMLFSEEAAVIFPAFDPCKAVQVVARVDMPAMINMTERVLTHCIMDGDSI